MLHFDFSFSPVLKCKEMNESDRNGQKPLVCFVSRSEKAEGGGGMTKGKQEEQEEEEEEEA